MNKRPTMLTDSESFGTDDESLNRLYGIRELPKYVVPADFARTLERSLAERTEERDKLLEALSYFVPADFARTLEQMLAERTEERDKLLEKQSWLIAHPTAIEAAHQVVEWTKCEQERDTALAKLAKCREALERLEEVGILCQRAEEARYSDARIFARQTLEETK